MSSLLCPVYPLRSCNRSCKLEGDGEEIGVLINLDTT